MDGMAGGQSEPEVLEAQKRSLIDRAKGGAQALWRGPARNWILGAAALVAIVVAWRAFAGGEEVDPYRTAAIDRGGVTRVVSATGALEPLVKVDVGSTVSGLVLTVEADFNSAVRVNQVLARLDPSTFQQRVTQAQANLAQAQAQLGVAEADYQRYLRLQERGFASDQLILQQRAARDSARAVVDQTRAALESARIDMDRSVIRSPIEGVVVDRQVDVGQSVAASFQAPILFVIAQDLSRLQANIVVDEADIGEVREGQPVRFTVDAFPDGQFDGRVSQVRQQGVSESGVVSYTVVVEADNPRRTLLPGMTANAEIVIEEQADVMRVPNAALRFRPTDARLQAQAAGLTGAGAQQGGGSAQAPAGQGAPGAAQAGGGPRGGRALEQLAQTLELTETQQAAARDAIRSAIQANAGGGEGQAERRAAMRRAREAVIAALEPSFTARQKELLAQMRAAGANGERREVRRQAVVWVLREGKPTPVSVEIGVADSANTVLLGGDLREGDEVIIGGGPQAPTQQQGPMGGGGAMRIRGA